MVATDGRGDRGVVLLYLAQEPIRRGQGNEGKRRTGWVFRSEKRSRARASADTRGGPVAGRWCSEVQARWWSRSQ